MPYTVREMMMKTATLLLTFAGLCFIAPPSPSLLADGSPRVIEVHAHRYAFEPFEITLRQGETVELKLFSDDVPHSLLITDLGVNVPATKSHPGEATLTARNVGDFRGLCGRFCGSGHGRMVFTVHVIGN
jgi:cytochrome c oxidase subunit II